MSFKYLSIFIAASLLIFFYAVSGSQLNDTDFEKAKEIIIMRKIGHEVLLHSGDSTSRVLPVKQIAENEYQIRFASQFTFKPDSLVKIIHRTIHANQLPSDYIVNVKECTSNEMIFGYAIFKTEQKNIIPCRGRQQSKGCYLINISFQNTNLLGLPKKYATAGIGLFALVLLFSGVKIYYKKKRTTGDGEKDVKTNSFELGNIIFTTISNTLPLIMNKLNLPVKNLNCYTFLQALLMKS